MEVRNRRRSTGASASLCADENYSAKNNYGFNKAHKTTIDDSVVIASEQLTSREVTLEERQEKRAAAVNKSDHYMDESPIEYPDNLGTFTDGLKGDIFELFETGAKVLNKSFKLLLPFGSESSSTGTADVMRDIEIRSPLANVTNKSKNRSNYSSAAASAAKSPFKTAEEAIRMRCSSMWRKETPMNSAAEPFLPMPRKDLFPSQGTNAVRVKEGVKVQLNKLNSGNGSIQSFECCEDTLLLVGNRRIILAAKNFDVGNTGTVIWSQPLRDIDSCTITFNSNPSVTSPTKVRLELSTQGGKLIRKVSMPNTLVCSKALQVIQERKVQSRLPDPPKENKPAVHATTDAIGPSAENGDAPGGVYEGTSHSGGIGGGTGAAARSGLAVGGGGIKGIATETSNSSELSSSDELAASISAVIAATRGYSKPAGGMEGASTPAPSGSIGKGSSSSSSKKSPELVAADALIADITAILKNLELKSEQGRGSGLGNGGGPGGGGGSTGSYGGTGDDYVAGADRDYASPMKRMCYDHPDKDFGGALLAGDVSPAAGVLLNFTPGAGGNRPSFSHGATSPLSPSTNGQSASGRKKHRSSRRNLCSHSHGPSHGSPLPAGYVRCSHPECMFNHAAQPDGLAAALSAGAVCMHGATLGSGLGGAPAFAGAGGGAAVGGGGSSAPADSSGTSTLAAPANAVNIDKFRKMLSLGVPMGAVQQKMIKEGVDPELLNSAPAAEKKPEPKAEEPPKTEEKQAESAADNPAIEKFKKMLKAGVPLEAVKHKMKTEGLDPALLDGPKAKEVIEAPKLSPEEEKSVEKFKKMLKAGVPLEAVKHKMKAEGIDPDLLDGPKPKPKEAVAEAPKLDPEQEKAIEKFKKMLKAGVPLEAVKHKMKAEGLDPALLDGPKAPPSFDTAKLKKFQMMLKAGVEVAAVLSKMAQEGFSKEEQAFVTGQSSDAAAATAPPPAAAPNKLIALHWDPMAHNDLKDSIWGKLQGSDKIKGLGEEEMERLASMFGKKEKKDKVAEEKKPEEKTGGPPKLTVIDTTRGMNVSIGLTSFKSQGITIDQMGAAVEILDTKFLGIDCLLRIKEILPNDAEIKSLQGFNEDNGHPAEICLFKLSKISRVRVKVDSMIFMSTMASTGSHLTQSLLTLREVAGRILISEGLKEIMVSVLAIGNAMNQGNWKGSAMGFKLGSLIKLAQTKSTDGKNTLIDYLILVLHERAKGGSAVCEAALEIDEELGLVKQSKHFSMSEITKDCNNLQRESTATSAEAQGVIDLITGRLGSVEGEEADKMTENLKSLQDFQESSSSLATSVSQSLNETLGKFKELAAFFGEDQANVGSILTTLSEFIDHFAAAKQSFNRKNRKRPLKEK